MNRYRVSYVPTGSAAQAMALATGQDIVADGYKIREQRLHFYTAEHSLDPLTPDSTVTETVVYAHGTWRSVTYLGVYETKLAEEPPRANPPRRKRQARAP